MIAGMVRSCSTLALAGLLFPASAATLLVPDQYPSILDALTVAVPGDVIELTQNLSPYTGNHHITIDNLTIQGAPALDPPPQIIGQSSAHPRAGEGPQPWFWTTGSASAANPVYDTHGAAIINDADGLVLRNLSIASDPVNSIPGNTTAGAVDFRFGTNGLIENCIITGYGPGPFGSERPLITANSHVLDGVSFEGGVMAFEHMGGGELVVRDSTLRVVQHLLFHNGGTLTMSNTHLETTNNANANYGCVIGNQYGPNIASFDNCVFRKTGNMLNCAFTQLRQHDRSATHGIDDFNSGRYSPHPLEVSYNQCDFIGGPANQISRVVFLATGRVGWVVKKLTFTGCNFFNIHGSPFATNDFAYPGNQYMADAGPVERFEDYNVYKLCQNTAPIAGIESGGNSITLNQGEPLYVDPDSADFSLAANSPAATLNPAPGRSFTGAIGVSTTNVPQNKITVGHTGADFSTINEAIAAATPGTLIEITDNSAPYSESLLFPAVSNAITLQGSPSLSPAPVIAPSAGSEFAIRLATSTSRNHTLRNLVVDGQRGIDTGEKMTVDLRDAGETVLDNLRILGDADVSWCLFTQNSRLISNTEVTYYGNHRAIQQNVSGIVLLRNINVISQSEAARLEGGMYLMKDCVLRAGTNTVQIGFAARSSYLDATNTVFTTNASTDNTIITALHVPTGRRTIVLDNCDLIGSAAEVAPGISATSRGIHVHNGTEGNPLTFMNITDTIFHRIGSHAIDFDGNLAASIIPGLTYEPTTDGVGNFNVYHNVPNTLLLQGIPGEADVLEFPDGVPLYANLNADEYYLVETSPAATFNSTGEPPHAGAWGIQPTSNVTDWAIY